MFVLPSSLEKISPQWGETVELLSLNV